MDSGPYLQTARGRRRAWRAATRAAQEARETEQAKWEARENEKKRKQHTARCLPLVNTNCRTSSSNDSGSSASAMTQNYMVVENMTTGDLKLKELVTKGELLFEFEFDNVYGCRHLLNVGDMRVAAIVVLESIGMVTLCGASLWLSTVSATTPG